MTSELAPGSVVLVGGGPGDPGLITLAGLDALRQADVIVHDRLGPLECLEHARRDAEIIPVGKVPRGAFTPQEEINAILIDRARQGLRVVRLKGGDSFVFGRGGEECIACAEAGIPVRVIPGITSAIAVPGLAGIPVTHRGLAQGVVTVSGHVPPGHPESDVDWGALARANLTIVVLMGVQNLPLIVAELMEQGLAGHTPAAVIADGTTPDEVVLRATLATIATTTAEAGISPPAIVVIGSVTSLELS